MIEVLSIHAEIRTYLKKRRLERKFEKQIVLLKESPFHPSLKTELLEPKNMRIWSFRIDKKYRAIFIFRQKELIEIIEVNNHYQ